jgi:Ca2+-binding RTX toxin-like protein
MAMAYNITGTNGNDTLNQSVNGGPGTIAGLAGSDCILTGTGLAAVTGDSGNDTVVLQSGNIGIVNGGTDNDSIFAAGAVGSMILFAGDGLDLVNMGNATAGQTILGGNDATDGADSIIAGTGADLVFGNGGNDTLNGNNGTDTLIGGVGNDSIFTPGGAFADLVFGNEGNDTTAADSGNDTVFGGLGDDSLTGAYNPGDDVRYFGNEGADTIILTGRGFVSIPIGGGGADTFGPGAATIVGGNDSADGNDLLAGGAGADFIFGNGGDDRISAGNGVNTVVGGFGADTIVAGNGADLIFANESNDSVRAGDGDNTVFGGRGDDVILAGAGADTIQGNEGDDTILGDFAADTISGGGGRDLFLLTNAADDGNGAAGAAIEHITDLNWAEDRLLTLRAVAFAANVGAPTGANLSAAAGNALAAALTLGGDATVNVAAQFTFGGHTYVAINQDTAFNAFDDAGDLLLDITGATGTIAASRFDSATIVRI